MALTFLPHETLEDNLDRLVQLSHEHLASQAEMMVDDLTKIPSHDEAVYILNAFSFITLEKLIAEQPQTETIRIGNMQTQTSRSQVNREHSAKQVFAKIQRLKPGIEELVDFHESPLIKTIQAAIETQDPNITQLSHSLEQEIQNRKKDGKETRRFESMKISLQQAIQRNQCLEAAQ